MLSQNLIWLEYEPYVSYDVREVEKNDSQLKYIIVISGELLFLIEQFHIEGMKLNHW